MWIVLVCCFEGISFIYRFNNEIQSILRDKDAFFNIIGDSFGIPYDIKKPSGQDRTAAEKIVKS